MITLYPDQTEFIGDIRAALKTNRAVLGVASTGFGKTRTSAWMCHQVATNNKRAWFLVDRRNLLKQTAQEFWKLGIEHGVIQSGRKQSHMPIQVGSAQTLRNRLEKLEPPEVLIADEAHGWMAPSLLEIIVWAKERGSIILGNSATPCRLDGKPLGLIFDSMVEAKPMRWLIDNGRLSDYDMYSLPNHFDLDKVKTTAGEYDHSQLDEAMDVRAMKAMLGDSVKHWKQNCDGARTILYAIDIKRSKFACDDFNSRGIPAVHIDGTTGDTELKDAINGIADGKYKILCNCNLATTGFDLSSQVGREVPLEALIDQAPTLSLAKYLQKIGRVLRKKDYPAIIHDHVGNKQEHGLPDDDREWSLTERIKRKKKGEQVPDEDVRQCATCFKWLKAGVTICPKCETEAEKKETRKLELIDGDLVKVDKEAERKAVRQEQWKARDVRGLIVHGVRQKMKHPDLWAANVFYNREFGRGPTIEEKKMARDMLREIKSPTVAAEFVI